MACALHISVVAHATANGCKAAAFPLRFASYVRYYNSSVADAPAAQPAHHPAGKDPATRERTDHYLVFADCRGEIPVIHFDGQHWHSR